MSTVKALFVIPKVHTAMYKNKRWGLSLSSADTKSIRLMVCFQDENDFIDSLPLGLPVFGTIEWYALHISKHI